MPTSAPLSSDPVPIGSEQAQAQAGAIPSPLTNSSTGTSYDPFKEEPVDASVDVKDEHQDSGAASSSVGPAALPVDTPGVDNVSYVIEEPFHVNAPHVSRDVKSEEHDGA